MILDKTYDLIISLGEDCACTSYLRRFRLQNYTYPFDWLTGASFDERINLIISDFKRFIDYNDLEFYPKPKNQDHDLNCDYYKNIYNGVYFYHDFPINIPLEQSLPDVIKKYNRRIKRMYQQIQSSKNILSVWWSRDKHLSNDVLKNSMEQLTEKFLQKNIYLLIIEYNDNDFNFDIVSNNILKISFDNTTYKINEHWNEVLGHENNNSQIFKRIKLKFSFKQCLKKLFYIIQLNLVNIIPIKKIRKKYRSKIKSNHNYAVL